MATQTPDVHAHGSMGFYTFVIETERAADWVGANVDLPDWATTGSTFHVDDTRLANDILSGMQRDGLTTEVN